MKRLIVIAVLGFLFWQGYTKHPSIPAPEAAFQDMSEAREPSSLASKQREAASTSRFNCDGRIYCSQMTSCAEATFFLDNCPGVKMDGNNDGVACERQWCR